MVDCCIFSNAINCHQVDCCRIPRTCTVEHPIRTMGAPTFPIITSIAISCILVISTAYQWMAGAMPCTNGIKGWLGSANASA